VPLQPEHGRQGQPLGGKDRPRTERDHDGIAFDDFAVNLDTRDRLAILAAHDAGDLPEAQLGPLRLCHPHHCCGKPFGMNLGGGGRRTQPLVHRHAW